jgi:hypothetical protein
MSYAVSTCCLYIYVYIGLVVIIAVEYVELESAQWETV